MKSLSVKQFLLYIFLPGLVLGGVYQSGRNAGESSAVERLAAEPFIISAPLVPAADAAASTERPPAARRASFPAASVTPAPAASPFARKPVSNPASGTSLPKPDSALVVRTPASPAPREVSTVPASRVVAKPILAPIVPMESDDVVFAPTFPPATNVPAPLDRTVPSVYDRGVPMKVSELGVMPLEPLEQAVVYPAASKTTFKQPVVPPVPVPTTGRSLSPVRITSSSTCDCGKEH